MSGKAAIGTVMNPGTNLIPMAVARVKQQHPAIHISVEVDSSKPLVGRLLSEPHAWDPTESQTSARTELALASTPYRGSEGA
jgi:hypothetical protein